MPVRRSYLKTALLIARAREQLARALPTEAHQSYPIPVRHAAGLRIHFLYGTTRLNPRVGLYLSPPKYLARFDARTGQLEEFRAVTAEDFGMGGDAGAGDGLLQMPEGMTREDYLSRQARLYEAYDVLLPAFAARETDVPPAVRKAANEFRTLFPSVSEASLKPCYRAEGRDFFSWLDQIAR